MLTTKIIGDSYEIFICNAIKNDFDKVWLWKDLPEYILFELNIIHNYDIFCKYRYDIGADLVAKKDDKYYFIQCKNYKETILMENLAGFYFLLHEYNLNGILYYNGNLSQRVKDLSTGKIKFINLPFNNQTITINQNIPDKFIPREYQTNAYNLLKNYNKCVLSLPCGMGKTFTASLLAEHYNNIIIFAPLRCLAKQLLEQFKIFLGNNYQPILISSDGYRNIKLIETFISDKNIICSTYDSADIVLQLLPTLNNVYLIIDEFHNLSFNNLNNSNDNLNKILNLTEKQLFLSATPIISFVCDEIYKYSWNDAIKNKYICDFQIIIQENDTELYKFVNLIKMFCSEKYDDELIAKAYFILRGMRFNGNKKCICYVTCIELSTKFNDILYWMSKLLYINLDLLIITYNTSNTKREKYINEFKNSKNISIILNVHILDEGIDIQECDSVFIIKPNYNIANIVQRMCRANRITENKSKCNIYLWCCKNKIMKVLNYLSENAEELIDKIFKYKVSEISVKKIDNIIIKKENNNKITYKNNNKITDFLKQFLTIHQYNTTISSLFWARIHIILRYSIINFENSKIIIIIDNNKIIWFNAKQICKSLEYIDTKQAISNIIEKEDKIQLKNININFDIKQQPDSIYINESGLYTLLITSKNKKSKKFLRWITSDVLPNLRRKNIFSSDEAITNLLKKINELETKNKLLQNDLKLEKFPDGGLVYVIEDIDIDGYSYYRIGKTDNMNKRIQIYNTHSIHNKKVVHYVELLCPSQLETCVRAMLYKYRYKNKKDYFTCSLEKIKKSFNKCVESIKCIEEQTGGTYKITYFEGELKKIYDIITIASIN